MTRERPDVLARDALRAGSRRDEGDRARHRSACPTCARVEHRRATPSRSPGAHAAPAIASSSDGRPAATSRAADVVSARGHRVDDLPLRAGVSVDAVGAGDGARLGDGASSAARQLRVAAELADRRWIAAVAAASAAIRRAASPTARASRSSVDVTSSARRAGARPHSRARACDVSDASVITGAGVVCTIWTGRRGRPRSARCCLPPTRSPKRSRAASMCSMPVEQAERRRRRDGVRIDAVERLVEHGRLHRDEQEVDRLARARSTTSGRDRFTVCAACLERQPVERDQRRRVRTSDADDRRRRRAQSPPRGAPRRRRGREPRPSDSCSSPDRRSG